RSVAVIKDLRDWNSKSPQFLKDVAEGQLHFYFSDKHETTARFLAGENPTIFSVIRYLTKAFQYELKIRDEDLPAIKKIVQNFKPSEERSSYVAKWLEKNGPKLVRHAVDVEYAWDTLEDLGLREKLIATSDPRKIESLGWWLNKEPLRSAPI